MARQAGGAAARPAMEGHGWRIAAPPRHPRRAEVGQARRVPRDHARPPGRGGGGAPQRRPRAPAGDVVDQGPGDRAGGDAQRQRMGRGQPAVPLAGSRVLRLRLLPLRARRRRRQRGPGLRSATSTPRCRGTASLDPYTLRVTHVYRREDGDWKIVHRHADAPPARRPPSPRRERRILARWRWPAARGAGSAGPGRPASPACGPGPPGPPPASRGPRARRAGW